MHFKIPIKDNLSKRIKYMVGKFLIVILFKILLALFRLGCRKQLIDQKYYRPNKSLIDILQIY